MNAVIIERNLRSLKLCRQYEWIVSVVIAQVVSICVYILTLKGICHCLDEGRMQAHKWALYPNRPVYKKCLLLPPQLWAHSEEARSLFCCRSPEEKMRAQITFEKKKPRVLIKFCIFFFFQTNLLLNEDIDSLKHAFTGELKGKVRLKLKWKAQNYIRHFIRKISFVLD